MAAAGMLGAWTGKEVKTGHSLDGTLGAFHWRGKCFDNDEAVHPLVMRGGLSLNPTLTPLSLLQRWSRVLKHRVVALLLRRRIASLSLRFVESPKPLLASRPCRDLLFVTGADDVEGLKKVRGWAADALEKGLDDPLTQQLFVRRDGGWRVFDAPESGPVAAA